MFVHIYVWRRMFWYLKITQSDSLLKDRCEFQRWTYIIIASQGKLSSSAVMSSLLPQVCLVGQSIANCSELSDRVSVIPSS